MNKTPALKVPLQMELRFQPQFSTLPSPALRMNILEAEGGAEAAARLASPRH
jgi:hypothetical protein